MKDYRGSHTDRDGVGRDSDKYSYDEGDAGRLGGEQTDRNYKPQQEDQDKGRKS